MLLIATIWEKPQCRLQQHRSPSIVWCFTEWNGGTTDDFYDCSVTIRAFILPTTGESWKSSGYHTSMKTLVIFSAGSFSFRPRSLISRLKEAGPLLSAVANGNG